jgi:hypothetical protein
VSASAAPADVIDTTPAIVAHSDASWTQQPTGATTTSTVQLLMQRSASLPTGAALLVKYPRMSLAFGTPQLWRSSSLNAAENGLYMLVYPLTSNAFVTTQPYYISGTTEELQSGSIYAEVFNQNWQLQDTEAELMFGAFQADGKTPGTYTVNGKPFTYMYESFENTNQQVQPQFVNAMSEHASSPGTVSVACQVSSALQVVVDVLVPAVKFAMGLALPKYLATIAEMGIEGIKSGIKAWVKVACTS